MQNHTFRLPADLIAWYQRLAETLGKQDGSPPNVSQVVRRVLTMHKQRIDALNAEIENS